MPKQREYSTKEALEKVKISKRRLALWQNKYRLFKIDKRFNPILKAEQRIFKKDTIRFLKWIRVQIDDRKYSIDAVKLAIEHYRDGAISMKWYK